MISKMCLFVMGMFVFCVCLSTLIVFSVISFWVCVLELYLNFSFTLRQSAELLFVYALKIC